MKRLAMMLALVACGTPSATPDAAQLDAGPDAPSRPPRQSVDGGPAPLPFAPCRWGHEEEDCGPEVFCNFDYPRGMCTPYCTDDAQCAPNGACIGGNCRPRCTPAAGQCRDDMFCDPDYGACFPSCSARRDADAQRCRVIGDACRASYCASAGPIAGGPIGAACASYGDCANKACLPALWGWPGGTCTRLMRAPGWAAYHSSGRLPAGGCLDQYAVVPLAGTEGDVAACVRRCASDLDCRDGYRCDRRVLFDAPEHTDGACVPWWCGNPLDVPCGPDRECVPFAGSLGACMRAPPP